MAVASLIIAVLSLLFGGYTYLRYDKRLKEQQRQINDYQLAKIQQETSEQQRAEVRASVTNVTRAGFSVGSFTGTLVIKNYGKGTARHVTISNRSFGQSRFNLPWLNNQHLLPQEQIEYPLDWGFGHGSHSEVILSWTDDSGERRENKCPLNL